MKEWFCIYLARDRKSGPFSLFLCRLYTRDILASGDAFRSTGGCNSNRTSDRTEFWNFTFKSFFLSFGENMSFIKIVWIVFWENLLFDITMKSLKTFQGNFWQSLNLCFQLRKENLPRSPQAPEQHQDRHYTRRMLFYRLLSPHWIYFC